MCRDGSSEAGADEHAKGLVEREEPCVDKTDDKDGGGSARLQEVGETAAGKCRRKAVSRQFFDETAESAAGEALKTVGHSLHAEYEEAEPAERLEHLKQTHTVRLLGQGERAGNNLPG